jgi:hypothetical protein
MATTRRAELQQLLAAQIDPAAQPGPGHGSDGLG